METISNVELKVSERIEERDVLLTLIVQQTQQSIPSVPGL